MLKCYAASELLIILFTSQCVQRPSPCEVLKPLDWIFKWSTDDYGVPSRPKLRGIEVPLNDLICLGEFARYDAKIVVHGLKKFPFNKDYFTARICLFFWIETVQVQLNHDDVIKWKRFPRCWPFVWVNNRDPGYLRRRRTYYDFTVMPSAIEIQCRLSFIWLNIFN